MLDAQLLALLVCPETHQDLALASPEELTLLNKAIGLGDVQTVAGKILTQSLEAALIRSDRAVAYPVLDDIPVMLIPEGLAISRLNLHLARA